MKIKTKLLIVTILCLILSSCTTLSNLPQAPYNTTNLTAANDMSEYTTAVNSLTGNMIGLLLLIVIWLIAFIGTIMSNGNTMKSMTIAFFGSFLLCLILVPLGWVGIDVFTIVVICLAASVVIAYVTKPSY